MPQCIALLSGGLDSILAVRIMQEQGIDVLGVNFKTVFTCCQDVAGQAARDLGIKMTVITQDDDYFDLVRKPAFGYGRAANPCIDCRIYMFQRAGRLLESTGADFLVSGEIVGQRPKSQKRRDLEIIAHHSDPHDRLLRPLCAKRLPPTWPEREGLVDRERLYNFVGRSRKGLIRLARRFGIEEIPAPSTGCQLTEPRFSRKVFDLISHRPDNERWQFELLKYGRHFRWNEAVKFVVGRNESDNQALEMHHRTAPDGHCTLLRPHQFPGPVVLVVGAADDHDVEMGGGMLMRYANQYLADSQGGYIEVVGDAAPRQLPPQPRAEVADLTTIATQPGRC